MAHEEILQKDRKLPVSMRVKIETPWMDSIKDAILDINEQNLIFQVANVYNLDIKLKYLIDPDKGKAKFIKDKKTLEIDLPIVGLTEETKQEVARQRRGYDEAMKRRLEQQGIEDINDYEERVAKFEVGEDVVDLKKIQEEALQEPEEETNSFLKIYDETKEVREPEPIESPVEPKGPLIQVLPSSSPPPSQIKETIIQPLEEKQEIR